MYYHRVDDVIDTFCYFRCFSPYYTIFGVTDELFSNFQRLFTKNLNPEHRFP